MADSADRIPAFLARHGFATAARTPLAGDASARRYLRLTGGPRAAILMDAPPARLDVRPFLRVGAWLRTLGLSAPEVIASDPDQGLVLLEDLGDDLFNRVLAGATDLDEAELYRLAIDVMVTIQTAPPPPLPPYDEAKFLEEANLLVEWFVPDLPTAAKADYAGIWQTLLPEARVGNDGLVYVDYHAENLLWLPARTGPARIGLLDFQDARLGPPLYDLVSLLEDARRDVAPELAAAMCAHYLKRRADLDPDAVDAACAILGAQRNAKILGLFARLAKRDQKPRYLDLLPRVQAHLRRDLGHPRLTALRDWCARHLPDFA